MAIKCISILSAALLTTVMMSSCSKKDDTATVKDVMGNYAGMVVLTRLPQVNPLDNSLEENHQSVAVVKSDSILVDMPFSVEDAKAASESDKIHCTMGYSASMNKTNDSIYLKLNPQPIVLLYGEKSDTLVINLKSAGMGGYAVSSKKLAFELVTGEMTLNGKPFEGEGVTALMKFSFDKK